MVLTAGCNACERTCIFVCIFVCLVCGRVGHVGGGGGFAGVVNAQVQAARAGLERLLAGIDTSFRTGDEAGAGLHRVCVVSITGWDLS